MAANKYTIDTQNLYLGSNKVATETDLNNKQDKLTAGTNITIVDNVISATGGSAPQYVELTFYDDGDTGTLTDAQVQILVASEINYIWLNGMHRLDFRYRDNNNNKATYSAVDTSSDGNKTHSVEVNLSTKQFTVYHRTLQEKLTVNPIDTSTATLSKIKIDDTIYSIAGGGEPAEYLLSAEVDGNNYLKISNKNGQEVVNCSVNYVLDNDKVKNVLLPEEREAILSGITGTLVTNTVYKTGEQDIQGSKTFTGNNYLYFAPSTSSYPNSKAQLAGISSKAKEGIAFIGAYATNAAETGSVGTSVQLRIDTEAQIRAFEPGTTNSVDLGSQTKLYKDAYIAGNLSDGTNNISVAGIIAKQDKLTVNPGSTTDTLSSITIDNVNYAISGSGTSDFNALINRPSYNGSALTGSVDIPLVNSAYWDSKSIVTVNSEGSSTNIVNYITVDGTEYKLPSGGSGEPAAYIKDAVVANQVLTLTKKDNTTVDFSISGKQDQLTAGGGIWLDGSIVKVDCTNASGTRVVSNGLKFVKCTQAEYNALSTKDSETFYIIVEE